MSDQLEIVRAALPSEYTINRELTRGGQGTVFLGTVLGQEAAIKLYAPSTDRKRVERELEFLIQADHPHLVRVLKADILKIEETDCVAVAYEFLPCGDLSEKLVGDQNLPPSIIARLGVEIGDAIEFLWSHRVVHRDVKPENILCAEDGYFVLADIGIARHLDRTTLTLPGRAWGTPGYMSPEQARGRKSLTIHSDIFALGVTLYEVAGQQHPFMKSQDRIGGAEPGLLSDIRPDLPSDMTTFIHQMMAVRPSKRPKAVSKRFRSFLEQE